MSLQMNVRASYREAGDIAELIVYLYDDVTKKYHPEKLLSGTVEFLSQEDGGSCLISRGELSKYMGNADGAFRVYLEHPQVVTSLCYKVELNIEGDVTLLREGTFDFIATSPVSTTVPGQPSIEPVRPTLPRS